MVYLSYITLRLLSDLQRKILSPPVAYLVAATKGCFYAELLTAREADGQRIHLVVQRQVQIGVPERALVHEPCRRGVEVRSLA